jgi:hypothetical protein
MVSSFFIKPYIRYVSIRSQIRGVALLLLLNVCDGTDLYPPQNRLKQYADFV